MSNPEDQLDLGELPIDSPERKRLPPLLRRAWYGLNQAFRRRISHTGATPDQFTALRCLVESKNEGITQRQLTTMMSSDPNTIASLVERLLAAGWIDRKRHAMDKRAYSLFILPDGIAKYEQLRDIAIELQSNILDSIAEDERDAFLKNLAIMADACRQQAREAQESCNG